MDSKSRPSFDTQSITMHASSLLFLLAALLATVFGFVLHYELLPRQSQTGSCESLDVTIEEAPWVQDLGCTFNSHMSKTCTTCGLWPNQCCQPTKLVNNGICLKATVKYQRQDKIGDPNFLAILCEEELVQCMKDNRVYLLSNATFPCYYTEEDPNPTTNSISNEGFVFLIVVFVIVEPILLFYAFTGCCKCIPPREEGSERLDESPSAPMN